MPDNLAQYIRVFVKSIRPWFFKQKEKETVGSYLFLNKNAKELKTIGPCFKSIMKKYFNSEASVSSIRKAMETAVAACSFLPEDQKRILSIAMLHDPITAERYYVMKDSHEESNAVNKQWELFRQSVLQPSSIPVQTVQTNNNSNVEGLPTMTTQESVAVVSSQQFELIPTSSLQKPVPLSTPEMIPTLEDSSDDSMNEDEQPIETTCQVAENIASAFVRSPVSSPTKISCPVKSPSPSKYPMQHGNWNCSQCGYTNFARRLVCNRCGKDKNKRGAFEEIEDQPASKRHKASADITEVLKKSTNSKGEEIYQVKSQKKGVIWVRAGHVPASLL